MAIEFALFGNADCIISYIHHSQKCFSTNAMTGSTCLTKITEDAIQHYLEHNIIILSSSAAHLIYVLPLLTVDSQIRVYS